MKKLKTKKIIHIVAKAQFAYILTCCLTLGIFSNAWAQKTASVSGNWNSTATWGGSSVPTSADAVTINTGVTVTVNTTTAACASLALGTSTGTASLTFAGSGAPKLTVTGAVVIGNSGAADRAGSVTFTNGSTLECGNLSLGAVAAQASTINMTAGGYLKVAGNVTDYSSTVFTAGTGTVEYNGAAQTAGPFIYNHLILSGSGSKTITDVATVNGNFTMSGNNTTSTGTSTTLDIGGNLIVNAGNTLNLINGNPALRLTGNAEISGVVVSPGAAKTIDGDFTINSGGQWIEDGIIPAYNFGGNVTNNGYLTLGAGIISFNGTGKTVGGTSAISVVTGTFGGSYTNTGTLNIIAAFNGSGSLTQNSGATLNIAGSVAAATSLFASASGNTVNYTAEIAQPVKPVTYFNLGISGGNGTIKTPGGSTTVSGTLSIAASTILAFGTAAQTLTLSGTGSNTLANSGTIDMSTGSNAAHVLQIASGSVGSLGNITTGTGSTINFNGAGAQSIPAFNFNNLSITGNRNSNAVTLVNGGTIGVAGTLTVTATGVTYTTTGNTVHLNGTGAQNINSGGISFNDLTISNSSGVILGSDITVTGNLNITAGIIATGSSKVIIGIAGSVSRTSGHVCGNLRRYVPNTASPTVGCDIGDAANYTPVSIAFTGTVTGSGYLDVSTAVAGVPPVNSGLSQTQYVNRKWTITNTGVAGFSTYSPGFTYVAGDLTGSPTVTNFSIRKLDGSAWVRVTTLGTPTATNITGTDVSSFSTFYIGENLCANGNYLWLGGFSNNWNDAKNWCGLTVPANSSDVVIPSGQAFDPVISSANGVCKNMTINSGATLTISGSNSLSVSGNWTNNGTFIQNSGAVNFNSAAATTIGGSSSSTFYDLIMTGTGNKTFEASCTLVNEMTFSGGPATIDFDGAANNKVFSLRSDAANTARIANVNGYILSGNVTTERYIPQRAGLGRAYRFLSSTVNTATSMRANWMEGGQVTVAGGTSDPMANCGTHITGSNPLSSDFDVTQTNQSSIYTTANGATSANLVYTPVSNASGTMSATQGYFLFVRGNRSESLSLPTTPGMPTSATTLRTAGTLLTGTQNNFGTMVGGAGSFNQVTNPYPSPIDWETLRSNCTGITNAYTLWDPNMGSRGGFVTWSLGSGASSGSATRYIQPGQAFFVEASGAAAPTVSIQETDKSAGNNNGVFLTPPPPAEAFRIELYYHEPNSYRRAADGAIAIFDNTYSTGIDNFDATEINNWDENIAIARNGKRLSIESRPVILVKDTLPLFMNNMLERAYEFEFTPAQFSNPGLKAELIDNFLNTRTLLSVTAPSVVAFTITADPASKATNRFTVIFGYFIKLSVDGLSIKAQAKPNGVQVEWSSKTETDLERYEVERSTYGTAFTAVNNTPAVGNSSIPLNYNWFDAQPLTGTGFYRIKAIDKAGAVRYSDVARVMYGQGEPSIVVYPNPVAGKTFKIDLNNLAKGNCVLTLYSNDGRLVHTEQWQHDGSQSTRTINLTGQIAGGSYQLQLRDSGGFKTTQTLIKK